MASASSSSWKASPLKSRNPRLPGDSVRRWATAGSGGSAGCPFPLPGHQRQPPGVEQNDQHRLGKNQGPGQKKPIQKKVAVDLLKLYAQRAKMEGFAYPQDMPWQQELEDSFPYQPTPDQLKSVQDVKRGYGKRPPHGSAGVRRCGLW